MFRRPAPRLRSVDGVSLTIDRHETVGLAGESGSGKTTLARALLRFYDIESGLVELEGRDITHSSQRQLRPLRRRAQMVFQDPYSSLNPRFTVRHTLSEVLRFHRVCPPPRRSNPTWRGSWEWCGCRCSAPESVVLSSRSIRIDRTGRLADDWSPDVLPSRFMLLMLQTRGGIQDTNGEGT